MKMDGVLYVRCIKLSGSSLKLRKLRTVLSMAFGELGNLCSAWSIPLCNLLLSDCSSPSKKTEEQTQEIGHQTSTTYLLLKTIT